MINLEPEECIGIEATDYLIEQGSAFAESVYEGPDDIITDGEINFDDTHPQHDELMGQFVEHSVTVIVFIMMKHPSALDGHPEKFVPFQRTSQTTSSSI